MRDAVNHPAHYNAGGIECIEALKAAISGLTGIEAFCTANAIKYLWRWKHKNGIEDIDKAIWYLNRLKKEVQTMPDNTCVCCGDVIPEGRQVCQICEKEGAEDG